MPTVRLITTVFVLLAVPVLVRAQAARGVVVDQTNLRLPGVRIEVHRGDSVVQVMMTEAARITLVVAHASEVTEVVAPTLTSSGAAMEREGSTMSASLAQRLPTARPHILQSLPLLPSVVRGRDGQLNIGGKRTVSA